MNQILPDAYGQYWDLQAQAMDGAMRAVDGSPNEAILRETGRWTADLLTRALDVDEKDRILELGCGVGRIGKELIEHVGSWTGTDASANMLGAAQSRIDSEAAEFYQLLRTELPFADQSFDKAYSHAVFCHLDKEDVYLYLRELHRVLKPQGLVYVDTWNLTHPVGWKRWQFEVDAWARSEQRERKPVGRNQFSTPEEMSLFAERAGFQIISLYADSPWIQLVLGRDHDAPALTQQRARVAANQIAYDALWSELFSRLLDVIYGVVDKNTMRQWLDLQEANDETRLFRTYLDAL